MDRFTLRQLEYLVTAADSGTISAAADRCRATQAAVSSGIAALEAALGTALLVRHAAKGVSPTAAGRAVLERARRILNEAVELGDVAREQATRVAGELTLGCTNTLSPRIFPFVAAAMREEFPEVTLVAREGGAREMQRLLLAGDVDALVVYRQQVQSGVDYRTLFPVRQYIALPVDHRLANRESVAIRELCDEPYVSVDPAVSAGFARRVIASAGVEITPRWTFQNATMLLAMVEHGLAWSILSGVPRKTPFQSDSDNVVFVAIADASVEDAVVLATIPDRETARTRALRDVLERPALSAGFTAR